MKKRLGLNDPYFRAGLLGFPFCGIQELRTHRPVFLLGLGFFAALFMAGCFDILRSLRPKSTQEDSTSDKPI